MEHTASKKYTVGIDAGSVSLNCMVINSDKEIVLESPYKRHFGKIEAAVLDLVTHLFKTLGEHHIRSISFTGNHGKKLAEKLGVEVTPDGYIRHDGKHRTNIPGVYSAGDVEGGFKQIVTASGQGAEAAMTIFEDLINPYWLK